MKKMLMILMAAGLMVSLVGCNVAKPKEEPKDAQPKTEQSEAAPSEKVEGEAKEMTEQDVQQMGIPIFGKVKNIVGNEIELEMANLPGASEAAEGEGDPKVKTNIDSSGGSNFKTEIVQGTGAEGEEAGGSDAGKTVFAMDDGSGNPVIIGGENGEKMKLDYTGESKKITIPAGAELTSMIGGEAKLDAIKKGSVLMITVPDDKAENLIADSVMIMEQ